MLEKLATTPISDLSHRAPIVVSEETPVRQVVDAMRERHRGAALVADADGRLGGIFTERDVLLKLGADLGQEARPVSELMSADPSRCLATDSVTQVLVAMRDGAFRHLPVVDDGGRPVGIVSVRDVLTWVAEHFPSEILNLPPTPPRRGGPRYGG